MSDVLPTNNEALSAPGGVNAPKQQNAIERLRKRMDNYRDMQNTRLPQYDKNMSHMNNMGGQETLVLRQKFLDSKQKKPNKKSSSASDKSSIVKHENNMANSTNGMMQYHGGVPNNHMMGPNAHMGQLNHPGGGPANKRALEEDISIPSETAKRLNLDNGTSNDVLQGGYLKREPSPMDGNFHPGAQYPQGMNARHPNMPGGPPGHPQGPPGHPQGPPGHPQGMPGHPQGLPGHPQGLPGHPQGLPGNPKGVPPGHPQGLPGHPPSLPGHLKGPQGQGPPVSGHGPPKQSQSVPSPSTDVKPNVSLLNVKQEQDSNNSLKCEAASRIYSHPTIKRTVTILVRRRI